MAAAAVGAVATVHVWGFVVVTAAVALVAYQAGRRRLRRRPAVVGPGRSRRKVVTGRISAACVREDHNWCDDPLCRCGCGHPGILAKPPLPADAVPPF